MRRENNGKISALSDSVETVSKHGSDWRDIVAVNWEYAKGNGSWPGFKHVAELCMEVLRQTNEIVGQDIRDLNPRLPKNETGALWTLSRTDDSVVCSDVSRPMNDAVEALKLLASLTASCTWYQWNSDILRLTL